MFKEPLELEEPLGLEELVLVKEPFGPLELFKGEPPRELFLPWEPGREEDNIRRYQKNRKFLVLIINFKKIVFWILIKKRFT